MFMQSKIQGRNGSWHQATLTYVPGAQLRDEGTLVALGWHVQPEYREVAEEASMLVRGRVRIWTQVFKPQHSAFTTTFCGTVMGGGGGMLDNLAG